MQNGELFYYSFDVETNLCMISARDIFLAYKIPNFLNQAIHAKDRAPLTPVNRNDSKMKLQNGTLGKGK